MAESNKEWDERDFTLVPDKDQNGKPILRKLNPDEPLPALYRDAAGIPRAFDSDGFTINFAGAK